MGLEQLQFSGVNTVASADEAIYRDESGDLNVVLTLNALCVRTLYQSVCKSYETWPGGHPEEQINLEKIKKALYPIYMELLYRDDIV